jgi:ABC-2 type transport system ATP-binding protein
VTAPVEDGASTLMAALRRLDEAGIAITDVGLRRPTLDDVFLTLTGHVAEPSPRPDGDRTDADAAAAAASPLVATPSDTTPEDAR